MWIEHLGILYNLTHYCRVSLDTSPDICCVELWLPLISKDEDQILVTHSLFCDSVEEVKELFFTIQSILCVKLK